jgi:DNA adenine methylase
LTSGNPKQKYPAGILFPEVGRPREAYTYALQILDAAHNKQETPENIFREIIRFLLVIKEENEIRMKQLLAELKQTRDALPLSSEEIVTLLSQHLKSKNASRLPVLIYCCRIFSSRRKNRGTFCTA